MSFLLKQEKRSFDTSSRLKALKVLLEPGKKTCAAILFGNSWLAFRRLPQPGHLLMTAQA
jgi:hypothetical protein